ncbi:MAG: alanine racemase [Candidatus Omnitrophica bacterium]|nr:alanine racemase [Candidatus Omnitrophota bacterium]
MVYSKREIGYRPTWAEVNLKSLAYNLTQIKKTLSAKTRVLATIKADGYGHGLIPVARKLSACKVDYFGVASIDEGIKLRAAGIKDPILILGLILKDDARVLFQYKLTPTICSYDQALKLDRCGRRLGQRIKVHIKVDTGMGRIGVAWQDAKKLICGIDRLKFVGIEGLFTHFALADTDKKFTEHQISALNGLCSQLEIKGLCIPLVHAANSMGLLAFCNSHFNMVRPGLVLYGLYPKPDLKIKLKPVLSLKTKVIYVKKVNKGCGISYGHSYVAGKKTTIVTLPIGYGDGYPRNLSNIGPVLIKGKRFKVSGRICMDQIMVDVGNLKVRIGDEAVLIGSQGKLRITAEELADISGTISYEIVCGLGSRIPRVYID